MLYKSAIFDNLTPPSNLNPIHGAQKPVRQRNHLKGNIP